MIHRRLFASASLLPVLMLLAGISHASPNITGVSASTISASGATISWTTDEPADSQVNYGTGPAYGFSSPLDTSLATTHSVNLSGLIPSTTYHYQVASRDASGNLSTLADFTFITAAAQAGIPLSNGTWTMVLTQGLPIQSNDWEQLVYAPAVKRSIMLSQYHQFDTEPNETLLGYNFDKNAWDIMDMGGVFHTENMPEGGESQGYFDFNPNNNTLMYHCCTSGSNQPENANHTWWYDVLGQSGRDEQSSPEPPFMALQPGGAFDAVHDVFVMEGGASYVGTWVYQPTSNTWTDMSPAGTLPDPSLILPAVAYDSNSQKVYLFGGKDGTAYNSNLYTYDFPSNTWTLVTPSNGVTPPGRYRTNFAYDSTNNIFLLYGGQNSSGILGDTWVYDVAGNTWTQLNPPQSPPLANVADFARLAYDSDHNVFVLAHKGLGGYFGSNWTTLAIQTWLFRYGGTGPNPGTTAASAQPSAGSLNRYLGGWAKDPALAASSAGVFAGWSETGSPFDQSSGSWPHIYAAQYSSGAWSAMGTSYQAISGGTSINIEAHAPSLAVIAGTPWISWYQSIVASGDETEVFAGSWNGSNWQTSGIGLDGTSDNQGRSQLSDVGGVPYIAFLEVNKSYYPQAVFAYVKAWNGTSWILQGGALNHNTGAGSTAGSVSLTSDGTSSYVAWTEYLRGSNTQGGDTATIPQVYAAHWDGSGWSNLGGSLNVSSSDWAYDASIAYLAGKPYVAWVERTQTGNALLYVGTWNGSSWTLVGTGPLNQNTVTGWAFHPSLVADAGNNSLYLGWVEQTALGQKAQVFVSRYGGGAWTTLGSSLNADPLQGSAQRMSLAVANGVPVVAWSEVNLGAMRDVYVKQWNGSNWIQLPGNGAPADTTAPTIPGNVSATAISANQANVTWSGSNDNVGVAGYLVYRGGVQVANVTAMRSFSDTALSPYASYSYTVAAYDVAGNISRSSAAATVTTQPVSPVGIAVLNLSPASVVGGGSSTSNTITLNGPAPSGGALVTLTSSNPSVASVPASVTVAAGASTSPNFTISTTAVISATSVIISASYNGATIMSTLMVTSGPVAAISSVNLSPTSVVGGGSTTANTVSLTAVAPQGGATVTLASNNATATVPASVTVPAGTTVSPQFTITSAAVTATQTVTISATYNGVTKSASLTVTPAGTVTLSSITLSPKSVVGGVAIAANNKVSLSAAAPAGGITVALASSDPSVTVPAFVTVPGGARTSPAFAITTTPVSATFYVSISASYNGVTTSATLTVVPPSLLAVALSPNSVVGGTSTTNNYVKLNGPAPSGGAVVVLSSSNPQLAAVPTSVTVAAGATFSPKFTVITTVVMSNQSVTVSGTYNTAKTASLTVIPVALQSIALSPATVVGGVSYAANNKISLNGPAPTGGAVVSLTSSNSSVTVPASVTVTAGSTTSPGFAIATTAVSSTVSVVISVSYNGVTKTATLTVTPPAVSALVLSPTSIIGGGSTTANYVKLNGPAPAGGAAVSLASSNSQVASPPVSVTVAAGATISPEFTITTTTVTSNQPVTISAGYTGTSKSSTLTVTP